jgi:hypothetical protein
LEIIAILDQARPRRVTAIDSLSLGSPSMTHMRLSLNLGAVTGGPFFPGLRCCIVISSRPVMK